MFKHDYTINWSLECPKIFHRSVRLRATAAILKYRALKLKVNKELRCIVTEHIKNKTYITFSGTLETTLLHTDKNLKYTIKAPLILFQTNLSKRFSTLIELVHFRLNFANK